MTDNSAWYQRKLMSRGQQPAPQRQPLQPIQPQQQQQFVQFQRQADPNIPVTVHNFWDMMQHWRGGKAHKIDREPCPECGSDQYYSRTGDGPRRGPPPAPHCFSCGYNGLFQQGLPTSWQTS